MCRALHIDKLSKQAIHYFISVCFQIVNKDFCPHVIIIKLMHSIYDALYICKSQRALKTK